MTVSGIFGGRNGYGPAMRNVEAKDTLDPDPLTADAARAFLVRLSRARDDVVEALLFGSRARGDHARDSDADIAIVLRGDRGDRYEVGREMSDIAYDVMAETGILIHAVALWEGDWREPEFFGNPPLLLAIRREGVRL